MSKYTGPKTIAGMSAPEFAARLTNIEQTLKELCALMSGQTPAISSSSPEIKMIARELVNNPDLYLHRRKIANGRN